ncbi:Hypothetical predicted protein [Podarcis lilfordi]|uniref:Uncharacterized protein n=1 Tax=Podarcis lilfordi TaxID=74358 RepID=A0AA35LCQ7_9SAUR|nr:Hypothetical predicted protein [Podarcis lilfordi]
MSPRFSSRLSSDSRQFQIGKRKRPLAAQRRRGYLTGTCAQNEGRRLEKMRERCQHVLPWERRVALICCSSSRL